MIETLPNKVNASNNLKDLVEDQRNYFNSHSTLSTSFRLKQLKKLKSLLQENEDELHCAIHADFGKSKFENLVIELLPLYEELDIAIKNLKRWTKKKRVVTNMLNFPAKSYLVQEPLGVSLIIGAWNLPYNLLLSPLIGSIAAGNTALLKPSELSPRTSALIARIINTHFDKEYLHVVEGGIPTTTSLLEQRFDKVFFTGSPAVGKIVNKAVAGNLTNITLELGGKNPAIFTNNCSLKVSVKRMIWSKFVNSGQLCIAPDYALVHKDIKKEFLACAVKEIKKSNFSSDNNNYVQMINERHFDRVVKMIDPNKVYFGGQYDRNTRYIQPTIVDNVSMEDEIMQDEVFGPILPIIEYETIDQAFDIIKNYEKPLSAYLFSNNQLEKKRFLSELRFGNGGINDSVMQISNANLPFGGVGKSGQGRYHGKYSFECFSHFKSIIDKTPWIEPNIKYYGYNKLKLSMIKMLSKF